MIKLTVYYEGQFWVGVVELIEDSKLKVFRHVFGKEPTGPEIYNFVDRYFLDLISKDVNGIKQEKVEKKSLNPKRVQRQIAKSMKNKSSLSYAYEVLRIEREAFKLDSKKSKKQDKELSKKLRFEQKKLKKIEKRKGR